MKKKRIFTALVLTIILHIMTQNRVVYANSQAELWKYLFENSTYNKYLRPVFNTSKQLQIHICLSLVAIIDFNEVEETITITATLPVSWHDEFLTWDPAAFGNTTHLFVPQNFIWKPYVNLENSVLKLGELGTASIKVYIDYNGLVTWTPIEKFTVLCPVDLYKFPFDAQTCSLHFETFGLHEDDMVFVPAKDMIDLHEYDGTSGWVITSSSIQALRVHGSKQVVTSLTLQRKPLYFVMNILLPIILLSVLNICVFVLPVDSGEKASFVVTMFLSMVVFLTIVSGKLPENSERISLLNIYVFVSTLQSTLIAIITMIQIRVYFRDPEIPVPPCLQKFTKFSIKLKKIRVFVPNTIHPDESFMAHRDDIQNAHSAADIQNTQSTANIQHAGSSANIQNTHSGVNIQNAASNVNVQKIPFSVNIQNVHSSANLQNVHSSADIQNTHSDVKIQQADYSVNIQNARTPNTSSSVNIQNAHSSADIRNALNRINFRNTNTSTDTENAHSTGVIQNAFSSAKIQNTGSRGNIQNISTNANVRNTSTANIQNIRSSENVQNAPSNANIQNIPVSVNIQDAHSSANIDNARSTANIQFAHSSANIQNAPSSSSFMRPGYDRSHLNVQDAFSRVSFLTPHDTGRRNIKGAPSGTSFIKPTSEMQLFVQSVPSRATFIKPLSEQQEFAPSAISLAHTPSETIPSDVKWPDVVKAFDNLFLVIFLVVYTIFSFIIWRGTQIKFLVTGEGGTSKILDSGT